MSVEKKCTDVYSLLTDLSKQILRTRAPSVNYPCFQQKSDASIIKKLRSKAFEILLNKSTTSYCNEGSDENEKDPLTEILKYTFVLKCIGRVTQALHLESMIDDLPIQDIQPGNTVYSVLQFLIKLRNFYENPESEFNIFHYGKTNPALPEVSCNDANVPMFQTYPMEVFLISNKFEALLASKSHFVREDIAPSSTSNVSFIRYLKSSPAIEFESVRDHSSFHTMSLPCTPLYSPDLCLTDVNTASYFLPSIKDNEDEGKDYFSFAQEGIVANLPIPYSKSELVTADNDSGSESWISLSHSVCNEPENVYHDFSWNEADLQNTFFNLRTWESLGLSETSKQPLFATDTLDVAIHLATIKQANTLVMLPQRAIDSTLLLEEIPIKEFLQDVKLLLFGIESDSFGYNKITGFSLKKNVIIHGVGPESLSAACQQVIHWGNCFKTLSWMVEPDPQSGKLQQNGLIFKAMCTSIKELLLYYRAALLRIFSKANEYNGLILLFERVRPMATLITEVARLCRRNEENNLALGEGNGILTMIYEEVTKVTNPRVALVFYSILKSCCEVYFRFLEKWLFEGVCDDVYGEFMIKARPQYMRHKGHKFWTKSFVVCSQSVPGFLRSLTDSILQCGKAVRLLKICDPKNPVCRVFAAYQPELKVCLSVAMLREQLLRCQEYESRGEAALGPVVSLASAIQKQKDIEKEKANVAVRIQQNTILRIKGEQEELAKLVVEKKKNFLKILKEQATEVALYKEKEKEAELLADKLLLEKINQEQEEAEHVQVAERQKLLNYYEELANTIENRRLRSDWRVKRMNYHEKRVSALAAMRTDVYAALNSTTNSSDLPLSDITDSGEHGVSGENVTEVSQAKPNESFREISVESEQSRAHQENVLYEDENRNFAENNTQVEVTEICDTTVAACTDSNENRISPINVNLSSVESVTEKSSSDQWLPKTVILDIQEKNVSNEYGREKHLYRKNNETSDLQEFLRTEVMKESRNDENKMNANTVNRPTFLKFQRLDNMTAAQLNKMKILRQEYGMTPNNNEFSMIFASKTTDNVDTVNENDNISKPVMQQNLQNNKKNWEISHAMQETLPVTHSRSGGMKTDKLLVAADSNSRHHSENNVDTPMSCTTDNFAPSSNTPTSQLQTCEYPTPSDISSDMLSSFEATKSYSEQNFILPENRLTFSTMSFTTPTTPCATPSLTIADVKLIDNTSLHVYLEKSITVPLQVQSRLVNNAIIKYLLNEHNMLLHLHSLRSYFFLLNGEFAKSLTDALYARLYNIAVPIELFNSATLTNLLERALVHSFSSSYVNSELLSLSAVDIPIQLHISDPDALDCLCLNYKISWPLNIILDDMVMLQYSKVFKFLIMIGRVSWVLQEDFNIMKLERKAAMSEQYHKLQLYRHAMTQFINALHNYLTCSVLHESWTEFEKDLQNSLTLDQVYMSHVAYIKKILSRCMLNVRGEKMRSCLNNIFRVILQFHNRLRSQAWTFSSAGYTHPNFKKLDQMYKAFCELRTYMAHVAFKYTTSGYQPHLIHFLDALNINNLYDLTIKFT